MSEREPSTGKQCEICQAVVPATLTDNGLGEIEGDPVSLINHRWAVHRIPGVTRCEYCAVPLKTGSLANHLSIEHDLPPLSDAQRAQYDAERRIRDELRGLTLLGEELGEKITEAGGESTKKLDELLQELRGLRIDSRSLF